MSQSSQAVLSARSFQSQVARHPVEGDLGTGRHLTLTGLLPGAHVLTLRATDSDGMTGTASVTIYVTTRLLLPMIQR